MSAGGAAAAAPRLGGMVGGAGGAPAPMNLQGGPLTFDVVAGQTPAFNTTVYVGNLIPYATQADLIPLFQGYGYIVEIRMQADKGFAFVKLDTHENAAMAICQLQGQLVHGRPVKCSWGKDRQPGANEGGGQPGGMGGQPGGAIPAYAMVRRLLLLLKQDASVDFSRSFACSRPPACTAWLPPPTVVTPSLAPATRPTASSASLLRSVIGPAFRLIADPRLAPRLLLPGLADPPAARTLLRTRRRSPLSRPTTSRSSPPRRRCRLPRKPRLAVPVAVPAGASSTASRPASSPRAASSSRARLSTISHLFSA